MKPKWQNIPRELALNRWVTWKNGKIPLVPGTKQPASTTDPDTWGTLGDALNAVHRGQADGIGFVFTDTPYAGVDLDHCLHDEQLTLNAVQIVEKLDSYTEISPSGTGLHVIVEAKLPPGPRRKGNVEMYDTARYFTVTGHLWNDNRTIEKRQTELSALHANLFPKPKPVQTNQRGHGGDLDNRDIIHTAMTNPKIGRRFTRLWQGDSTLWGDKSKPYLSQSEADYALINYLLYYTDRDPHRADTLFRRSALYRPKWDRPATGSGKTYGELSIQRALTS